MQTTANIMTFEFSSINAAIPGIGLIKYQFNNDTNSLLIICGCKNMRPVVINIKTLTAVVVIA